MDAVLSHIVYLKNNLPPGMSSEAKEFVLHKISALESTAAPSAEFIDHTLVEIGKKMWPYLKAYHRVLAEEREKSGQKLFVKKLSPHAKEAYGIYCTNGGCYRDISRGSGLHTFDVAVQSELQRLVLDIEKHLKEYTAQSIKSTADQTYTALVAQYQSELEEIESIIAQMISLASKAQTQREQQEIERTIEHIEHGIAQLVRETPLTEVRQILAHIHEPIVAHKQFLSARI